MQLADALLLFKRLGVDVALLSESELTLAYFGLAKRYHPDQSRRRNHELMANINAARTIIRRAHFHRE